jgi:hypothetical protein
MTNKIEIGDIFEIKIADKFAYLQFVYLHNERQLVKIFCSQQINRSNIFNYVVSDKELFLIFFPVTAAFRKKIIFKVGKVNVHDFLFPKYMRIVHTIREEFLGWHIVNTETGKLQLVKNLDVEQKKLSSWGTWNDTLLIEQLENGWDLEIWNKDPYSL